MKVSGSTVELQLKLVALSAFAVDGIRGVAVKCLDITKNSDCEGSPPRKLKGIDGGPHKRRNMWFNSMIREEPYPGLNCGCIVWKHTSEQSHPWRCCMVVVSSCREVSA